MINFYIRQYPVPEIIGVLNLVDSFKLMIFQEWGYGSTIKNRCGGFLTLGSSLKILTAHPENDKHFLREWFVLIKYQLAGLATGNRCWSLYQRRLIIRKLVRGPVKSSFYHSRESKTGRVKDLSRLLGNKAWAQYTIDLNSFPRSPAQQID